MQGDINEDNIDSRVKISIWYNENQLILLNEGLRFGYSLAEVKDLLQQLFLELLEKQVDTSLIQNSHAYLITAFRRKLIDYHRLLQKKQFVDIDLLATEICIETPCSQLEIYEQKTELVKDIQDAFDKLPERCKKVIYLKFGKGKTTEEIASITGLARRSIYNNLFEGIQLLRVIMQKRDCNLQIATLLSLLPLVLINFS